MTGRPAASAPTWWPARPAKGRKGSGPEPHGRGPPGGPEPLGDRPLYPRVEGDRLYGRGTEDDHHGIVMSLMAVRAFLDLGITPERTLALALVADEETGNDKGLAYLLREHPLAPGRSSCPMPAAMTAP